MPSPAVQPVSPEDFTRDVLSSPVPVVVCFWAPQSDPSVEFAPLVAWAAETFQGSVKTVTVNEQEHPELAERLGVHALPTLQVFDRGQRVDQLIGTVTREDLEAFYRSAASRQPRPSVLYFAFSPVLDPDRLGEWARASGHRDFVLPEGEVAEALDVRLVYDRYSPDWGGRIAMLTPEAGQRVFGRAFEVSRADLPVLRRADGVLGDDVRELKVRVRLKGGVREAIAFATAPERATQDGAVSERYAFALARAAARAGLPAEYAQDLEAKALILQKVQRATGTSPAPTAGA